MNGKSEASEPALAMICFPTKQERQQQSRNSPPVSEIPAEFPAKSASTAIDARPRQSLPPKPLENGSREGEEEKKPEKEHKKRSKNWTRIEMTNLIRIRSEMEPRFCCSVRKSGLWDEISDLLRKEGTCRDAQQCRDKWEKLTAAYKDVRDGVREKEDYPFYVDLDPILSGKAPRRECQRAEHPQPRKVEISSDGEETEDEADFPPPLRKRPRKRSSLGDDTIEQLKELLESLMARQHRIFVDLMESMERRERIRESIQQEREEKWREEDRAERIVFQNAMLVLTKKLVSDASEGEGPAAVGGGGGGRMKKRSKNWKRAEVLLLIKLRREMEGRFAKSTKRALLWDELAGLMCAEGAKRDGKQCREKWDKLMAEFKDVSDGKRDRGDSPYFADLLDRGVGSTSLDNPTAGIETKV